MEALLANLPLVLLFLLCPLMMLFMHRGDRAAHGGHSGRHDTRDTGSSPVPTSTSPPPD